MAQVGLKDTLALLAKGYSKKEIDALAAIDEEKEAQAAEESKKEEEPVTSQEEKEEEPDYKKLYEDLKAQNEETEAKITKLQQDNVHKDSAPAAAAEKEAQAQALNDLVRGFM